MITSHGIILFLNVTTLSKYTQEIILRALVWVFAKKKLCIEGTCSQCNEQVQQKAINLFITKSLKIYQNIPHEANRLQHLAYLHFFSFEFEY